MMNNSDYEKEYSELLGSFILNMEKIPDDVIHPSINEASADICRFLRISRLEACLIQYPDINNREEKVNTAVYFSEGDYDENKSFAVTRNTPGGTAIYKVFPKKDAAEWTAYEHEKINTFVVTLFVFNGRARSMALCSYLSFYDPDIAVYNIKFYTIKLHELFREKKASEYISCRFNLKKFSLINQAFGREQGTKIMERFTHGLTAISGDDCCLCRLGGDNFLHLFSADRLETVKNYLSGASVETENPAEPYTTVSARFSIYHIENNCMPATKVIDKVTDAYSIMKRTPNSNCIVYDENVEKTIENQHIVEENFLKAIANEEFLVYYQPKVELKKYSLNGAEALCRWMHDGKLIPPNMFIPVLEQSSNICTLDFYMLEHVCRDIRRWLDKGLEAVRVSVNMSRLHLGTENLDEKIINTIKKYNVPHKYIEIELTETTSDVDFDELKRIVASLHNVGISTSIDDFGVGYSSLNLIRDLPWDTLKIDKSFLPKHNDPYSSQKITMLKHVIAMAQNLGLECLVEGVETTDHVAILKESECYNAQGFCFDKPLPEEEFEKRLRINN